MRFMKATVVVAVPSNEIIEWSEHSDVTRFLASVGLENRAKGIYLIEHDEFPKITIEEFNKMHKCFTEEGGI